MMGLRAEVMFDESVWHVSMLLTCVQTPTSELQKTYACLTGLVSFMISHASELFSVPESLMRDVVLQCRCSNADGASLTPSAREESLLSSDTSVSCCSLIFVQWLWHLNELDDIMYIIIIIIIISGCCHSY